MPLASGAGGCGFGAVAQHLGAAAIGRARCRAATRSRSDRPTPPSPMARPGASPGGSAGVHAGLPEARDQPRRPDRVEQPYRRHVERQLQRLAHADVALVAHVEILRPVAGEVGRPVLDQRLLRDQPLLEGEAVDERLQRRAGRAQRLRHVDPAGAAGVEEVRRADLAEDLAGHGVGQHHGDRHPRPEFLARRRAPPLPALPARFSGASACGASRLARCAPPRRRRAPRAPAGRAACPDTSSSGGARASRSPSRPGAHHAVEHAVARGLRAVSRLRSGRRRSGSCGRATRSAASETRQPLRLLAEIGERSGANAFEVAAIGRQRQVAFEDFALGQPPLDLDGAKDLPELLAEAAAFARLDQPGELHRQRRAARDDAAVAGELLLRPAAAPARRRRRDPGNACPHRRSASRRIADRPGRG